MGAWSSVLEVEEMNIASLVRFESHHCLYWSLLQIDGQKNQLIGRGQLASSHPPNCLQDSFFWKVSHALSRNLKWFSMACRIWSELWSLTLEALPKSTQPLFPGASSCRSTLCFSCTRTCGPQAPQARWCARSGNPFHPECSSCIFPPRKAQRILLKQLSNLLLWRGLPDLFFFSCPQSDW